MIIRPLGEAETLLALLHEHARGTPQTVQVVTIEGNIDRGLFLSALKHVFECYPILGARFLKTATGYDLIADVSFETIPVCLAQEEIHSEWLREILEQEANDPLPQDKYLWRATLVSSKKKAVSDQYIVLTVHHAICDGQSIKVFFDVLLAYFNNPEIPRSLFKVPEPLEKFYVSSRKASSCHLKELDALHRYQPPFQTSAPMGARKTRFKISFLTNEDVAALECISKKQGVFLNAVLSAAALLASQEMFGVLGEEELTVDLPSMVNLRQATEGQISENDIGYFCALVTLVLEKVSNKTGLFVLAKRIAGQLGRRTCSLTLSPYTDDHSELEKHLGFLWDVRRKNFCSNVLVSNVGFLHFDETGIYKIKNIRGSVSLGNGQYPIGVFIVGTKNGMSIIYNYCEPLISGEQAQQFIDNFNHFLNCI